MNGGDACPRRTADGVGARRTSPFLEMPNLVHLSLWWAPCMMCYLPPRALCPRGVTRHMTAGCERGRRWGAMVRRHARVLHHNRGAAKHAPWPQFCELPTHPGGSDCMNCHGWGPVPLSCAPQPATCLSSISPNPSPGKHRSCSGWDRLHQARAACSRGTCGRIIWSIWDPAGAFHATTCIRSAEIGYVNVACVFNYLHACNQSSEFADSRAQSTLYARCMHALHAGRPCTYTRVRTAAQPWNGAESGTYRY